MDDIDYGALEAQLDHLPQGTHYAPIVQTSGWKMWQAARKLKKDKKKAEKNGKAFSINLSFPARRPLASVGGWIGTDFSYTPEDEKYLREFFENRFKPKGLTVGTIKVGWQGMNSEYNGDYEELVVEIAIS